MSKRDNLFSRKLSRRDALKLLGAGFMLLALFRLGKDMAGMTRAQTPFFIGFGFMGYSLFRFIVLYGYRGMPHWLNFWEESLEFIMVLGVLLFLFLFRKAFGTTWIWFKKD